MGNKPKYTNTYYNKKFVADRVTLGEYRDIVGGMWDDIGELQFQNLYKQGLRPNHKLLDIGCGSLRGGRFFIKYLDKHNYFGTDINMTLINAGRQFELGEAELKKVSNQNFLEDENFDFSRFDVKFDYALAFSVFTHLTLNHMRACLEKLRKQMNNNGIFFATVFIIPDSHLSSEDFDQAGGNVKTQGFNDPYHYYLSDIYNVAKTTKYNVVEVENFNHPRGQRLFKFTAV